MCMTIISNGKSYETVDDLVANENIKRIKVNSNYTTVELDACLCCLDIEETLQLNELDYTIPEHMMFAEVEGL